MERVIIIGSGPAGLTAAIYAARANLRPLVLAGGLYGGQLMLTTEVENYPGFPEGILGPELMIKFREQAERFGARIENVDVTSVDFAKRPLVVRTNDAQYDAETVIVVRCSLDTTVAPSGHRTVSLRCWRAVAVLLSRS